MPRQTPVFIVTSSRPRVGKTLLARVFVEFFCAQNRPVSAFDVNPDEFTLVDYLPAYTAAASIRDTRGEMALFDQIVLGDDIPKVIDLGHSQFDRFFSVMQEINFEIEARRKAVVPMVLFLADPDERARQGYAMLNDRCPGLALVPVFNEAVPQIARSIGNFPPGRRGGPPVAVPALTPVLRSVIERRSFSFVGYARRTSDPTAELYQWTRKLFVIFRDLEVRLLLGELQPRLKDSA
jgi:hypothetical protein